MCSCTLRTDCRPRDYRVKCGEERGIPSAFLGGEHDGHGGWWRGGRKFTDLRSWQDFRASKGTILIATGESLKEICAPRFSGATPSSKFPGMPTERDITTDGQGQAIIRILQYSQERRVKELFVKDL